MSIILRVAGAVVCPMGGAVTAAAGITDDDHVRVVSCVIVHPLPIHSCEDKLTLQDYC